MAVDDKYTVALLHFDSDFTDECGGKWTPTGACVVDKSVLKLGAGALYTPNGAYLTCNNPKFAFVAGDFTIDFWMKYKGGYSGVSSASGGVFIQSDIIAVGTAITYTKIATPSFIVNEWAHYALTRSGGVFYYFVNGILKGSLATSMEITNPNLSINARYGGGEAPGDDAYYDEFRVSNVARWTSDFIPPTKPYSPGTPISAPTNLTATAGDSQVTLTWTAVTGATGYNVKRATIAGGPYTTIATNVSTNSYIDTTVTNGITYYYVVTAVNADGESANSNEASATPAKQVTPPSSDENVLLQVTMSDSSDREFQLSATEIDDFVNWYNHHESTDMASYSLNKNIGIRGSKEYLAFEKIISFEVMPLTK